MLALQFLLLGEFQVERLPLPALAFETRVAAAVERELAAFEVQDPVDGRVEQIAVVADDDHGAGIVRDMVFQPERALEIEVVGRLVKQQEIGLGEQGRRKRHPHAPAAGEFATGALLLRMGKAQPGKNLGGARRRRVGADIGEPRLDFGDAVRVARGLGLGQKPRALGLGLEHHVEEGFGPVRRLLREPADARAWRKLDAAALRRHFAGDRAEQGRLAGAVASDQADAGAGGNPCRGALEQELAGEPHRDIVEHEHARYLADLTVRGNPWELRRRPRADKLGASRN